MQKSGVWNTLFVFFEEPRARHFSDAVTIFSIPLSGVAVLSTLPCGSHWTVTAYGKGHSPTHAAHQHMQGSPKHTE